MNYRLLELVVKIYFGTKLKVKVKQFFVTDPCHAYTYQPTSNWNTKIRLLYKKSSQKIVRNHGRLQVMIACVHQNSNIVHEKLAKNRGTANQNCMS